MANKANSFPTKNFFINMLTRDISLNDAILDLLDNCLDGALRSQRSGSQNGSEKNYDGFEAKITISQDSFKIEDNCGGISRDLAENYAFRMGKQNYEDNQEATIGIYGIGMKRAIFKIGKSAVVETKKGTDAFAVKIPTDWAENDDNWTFEIEDCDTRKELPDGTSICVTNLTSGVAIQWEDQDSIDYFVETLISEIKDSYSLIIEKGFTIYVNNHKVKCNPIQLLLSKESEFKPYIFKKTYEGDVDVKLIVGFYAPPPSDDDLDEGTESKRSSSVAGWTIVCNDRVVLYNDKSYNTGWGEAGVPQYHTQFIGIRGMVIFESKNPAKLPMTTTKRGIDLSSPIYADVKNKMREGLKLFTNYTNQWKGQNKQERTYSEKAESFPYTTLIQNDESFNHTYGLNYRKKDGGFISQPNLPKPKNEKKHVIIRYSKPIDDVQIVKTFFSPDESIEMKASDVGEKCFEFILKRQRENNIENKNEHN